MAADITMTTNKMIKVLCPTSIDLDIHSLSGFRVQLQPYDVLTPIPAEHTDAEVLITWCNSFDLNLCDAARRLKNLKWIQALAAGPNDVLAANFPANVLITTGSGLHNNTVAEHTLGLLLVAARRFDEMTAFKLRNEWPGHLGGSYPRQKEFTTLRGAKILIWGFGGIAATLTPMLRAMGVGSIRGVARSPGVRSGVEIFDEGKLPELLPETDALVMILPGSDSTKHALNKARLGMLPKHAWVVNVGRGVSVDEEALADALDERGIGGAALDVFSAEPLPRESRLWGCRNLVISPHAAGGRPEGCTDLIAENLRSYLAGRELRNVMRI